MTENATMDISKKDLEEILMDYYSKIYKDEQISIVFESKKECGYYDDSYLVTRIKIKRTIKVGGRVLNIEGQLEKEDISAALNSIMENTDYEIADFYFKNEEGYYGYPATERINFNDLKVTAKRKGKQKVR